MTTSWLGVIVNILCALVKIIIGALAGSIAIISEGLNNAADVASSVLTIIGTKLAGKHPTKEHPFGFGRIEYLIFKSGRQHVLCCLFSMRVMPRHAPGSCTVY